MTWEMIKFSELFDFQFKSKIKAGEGLDSGKFPFFTSSDNLSKFINSFQFDKSSLIFGTGGNASIHYCNNRFSVSTDCLVAQSIDEKKVETKFVYYFISGNIHLLEEGFKGAGLKHISKGYISNINIPLPSLAVQKRIVSILDKADALRRKDQELLCKYDELAQAIFIDMFGDPVKNEKGWERIPFGELFDTRLGKMLDAKKQIGGVKYKYLGNSNVQWFRFEIDELLEMEFDEKEIKTFQLRKGDILICEGGEVGRAAIWQSAVENIYFQKAIHRARPKSENITPEYTVILFWFLAKQGGLKDYVTTSTISHLTGEKLKTLPIPVPPYKDQLLFSNALNKLNIQKELFNKTLERSSSLFQSLLQQSFRGELK
jgi:type I restriction enzyme S subunit